MNAAREWHTVDVCADCLYTAANGAPDWDGYGETGHAERYRAATVAHGGELVAECSTAGHGDPDTGEPCSGSSFSWQPCEWCGDTLGGDRFCASIPDTEPGVTCAECGGPCDAADSVADDSGLAWCGSFYGNGCADKNGGQA